MRDKAVLTPGCCPPQTRVNKQTEFRERSKGFFVVPKQLIDSFKVPVSLFAENRQRLVSKLRSLQEVPEGAVVLLQGGGDQVKISLKIVILI